MSLGLNGEKYSGHIGLNLVWYGHVMARDHGMFTEDYGNLVQTTTRGFRPLDDIYGCTS